MKSMNQAQKPAATPGDNSGASVINETPAPRSTLAGRPAPGMSEWITCGAIAVVAMVVISQMFSLGIGTLTRPQAGLWPLIVSVVILGAVPFAILDKSEAEQYQMSSMVRPIVMAVALLSFLPLYPLMGFILAVFIILFVITHWVCAESVKMSLTVALVTPVVSYLLFGAVFQVDISPLPTWLAS